MRPKPNIADPARSSNSMVELPWLLFEGLKTQRSRAYEAVSFREKQPNCFRMFMKIRIGNKIRRPYSRLVKS